MGGSRVTLKRIKEDKKGNNVVQRDSYECRYIPWPSGFEKFNIFCANRIFIKSDVIAGLLRRLKESLKEVMKLLVVVAIFIL